MLPSLMMTMSILPFISASLAKGALFGDKDDDG